MIPISSAGASHDQQVSDALTYLETHDHDPYRAAYRRVVAAHPEAATPTWSGSWWDTDAMDADVGLSAWVTDALEDTGAVTWREGEPYAYPVPPSGADWRRWGQATVGEWDIGTTSDDWLVLANVCVDLDLESVADSLDDTGDDSAESYAGRRVWDSTVAGYVAGGVDQQLVDVANAVDLVRELPDVSELEYPVPPIAELSPWAHAGAVWLAHRSTVDAWEALGFDVVAFLNYSGYPLTSDETHATVTDAYVSCVIDANLPDLDAPWTELVDANPLDVVHAAWWREQSDYGAANAWVEPMDVNEWDVEDLRELNEWIAANMGERSTFPIHGDPCRHVFGSVHRACERCGQTTLDLEDS